jgi:hypothetical protein
MIQSGWRTTAIDGMAQELAVDPRFGDWRSQLPILIEAFAFQLDILGTKLPDARQLAERLASVDAGERARVLLSPVVRSTIVSSVGGYGAPAQEDEVSSGEVFRDSATRIALVPRGPLETPGAQVLQCGPHRLWIRRGDEFQDAVRARFDAIIEQEVTGRGGLGRVQLVEPRPGEDDIIRAAVELLNHLLPEVVESLFAHVRTIALVDLADASARRDALYASGSNALLPGVVFLSRNALTSPWHAAEALYHEACHQKYHDIVVLRSIYASPQAMRLGRIVASWNPPSRTNPNVWSLDKAVLALHVYIYLSVFFAAVGRGRVQLDSLYGPSSTIDADSAVLRCAQRARHLRYEIEREDQGLLGIDGRALLDWLMQAQASHFPLVDGHRDVARQGDGFNALE